jgi:hypothetical protein
MSIGKKIYCGATATCCGITMSPSVIVSSDDPTDAIELLNPAPSAARSAFAFIRKPDGDCERESVVLIVLMVWVG